METAMSFVHWKHNRPNIVCTSKRKAAEARKAEEKESKNVKRRTFVHDECETIILATPSNAVVAVVA
jgi:prephenate dehydrogenase